MGWTITLTVSGTTGATRTIYTLDLPGLSLGSVVSLAKADTSQSMAIGDRCKVTTRIAGGMETVTNVEGLIVKEMVGYIASSVSPSGNPNVSVQPMPTVSTPCYKEIGFSEDLRGANSANDEAHGYSSIASVLKPPSETWVNAQPVYEYTISVGVTAFTNSQSTANSIGLLRLYAGNSLIADPAISGNWLVGVPWTAGNVGITVPDRKSVPVIPTTVAKFLTSVAQTNLESTIIKSFGTDVTVNSFGINAIDGIGTASLNGFSRSSQGYPPNPLFDIPSSQCVMMRQSQPIEGYGGNGYSSWEFSTGAILNTGNGQGGYNSLFINIPALVLFDAALPINSYPNDFSIDVTLPAPIGDCRIVWSGCNQSTQSATVGGTRRGMFPTLVRRTSTTVAPYTNAVLNPGTRDCSRKLVFAPADVSPLGIFVSSNAHFPYVLRAASTLGSIFSGVPREAFPVTSSLADLFAGASTAQVEFAWGYWDSSVSAWVNASASATGSVMSSGSGTSNWRGTVPAPSFPANYYQGALAMLARQFISGAWQPWAPNAVATPTTVPLPVWPWDSGIPPWLVSDADCTPVANAGWSDTLPRDTYASVSFTGTLTPSYSGSYITFPCTAITVSCPAVAMYKSVARSRLIWNVLAAGGMHSLSPNDGGGWFPSLYAMNDSDVSVSDKTVNSVYNPSSIPASRGDATMIVTACSPDIAMLKGASSLYFNFLFAAKSIYTGSVTFP